MNQALASVGALTTVFPNTSLGQQLLQVAKIIKVRSALGLNRQIFFTSIGGFDTHDKELTDQATGLGQVSQAMAAFYQATVELGVSQSVVTFTESDFGRTLQPSGGSTVGERPCVGEPPCDYGRCGEGWGPVRAVSDAGAGRAGRCDEPGGVDSDDFDGSVWGDAGEVVRGGGGAVAAGVSEFGEFWRVGVGVFVEGGRGAEVGDIFDTVRREGAFPDANRNP